MFQWFYGAPLTSKNVRQAMYSPWQPYSLTVVHHMCWALDRGLVDNEPSDVFLI